MRKQKFIIWTICLFLTFKGFAQCPAPTANISGTQSITQGQSATLTITLTGAAPWSITVNGQVYNNITSSPHQLSVSPATTTTYSISTVSNKCGNGTFSGSATVSVCIPATAVITGTQTINQGQSANLSVALTGNSPWSIMVNGQTYSNITTSPKIISVSPSSNTTYTISSISNPCGVGTKSGSAVVSVCHPATASITGTQTIAVGQSANLSVALTGDGPWSFTLNGQSYTNVSTSPKIIAVSPTANTTYTITNLSNACGAGTSSGAAVVSVCSPATATISGTQTITQSQSANLSVSLTGTSPWSFSLNGQVYSNVTVSPKIVSVNPIETTTYSLNSVSNSCGNGTVSGQALVTVYAAGCDPFENNDTPQKARLINSNAYSSLDHCFNTNADQDWYKWRVNDKTYFILFHSFNYASSSNYKFTLTYTNKTLTVTTMQSGASGSDTYIELYDSDGQTQLAYNDDYGGTLYSRIIYQIPDLPCNKSISIGPNDVTQSIYKASSYIKSSSQTQAIETVFDAKNYILLEPGFKAESGKNFSTKLNGCQFELPTSGLIAHYSFDGTVQDLSGNNHHGTNQGGTFAVNRQGVPNKAISLLNGGSQVVFDNFPSLQGSPFSICFWMKVDTSIVMNANILSKHAAGTNEFKFNIDYNSVGNSYGTHSINYQGLVTSGSGYGGIGIYNLESFIDNNFHFYCFTITNELFAGHEKIFFDAQLKSIQGSHGFSDALGRLSLGDFFSNYQGGFLIDDLRIYNRELSDTEIQLLVQE
ncbi:hypothetical protein EGI22_08250 [Lacihabitans sp. LS3-19]|uniref:LamG-like jellyroll fold domain-containing protein n=1 Tax=Lacihabitans sp. LS3-19 TaxID=2487335 RepID=UPI0020CD7C94|nr:3-coathanger stack domain-containing protein [Lacihabitans sp. LS3-19]MCP9767901.1 hypothetical protein [Lacihabitans sp. LS3-19]